jgi:hypothetical protein
MTPAGQRLSRPRWGFGQVLVVLLAVAAIVAAGAVGVRQIEMAAPLTNSGKPLSDDEIYTGSRTKQGVISYCLTIERANSKTTEPSIAKKPTTEARPARRCSGPPCEHKSSAKASGTELYRQNARA